eukprot:scaffold287_cov239-Pinguiococcus_pyrenoidosus.AAC.10
MSGERRGLRLLGPLAGLVHELEAVLEEGPRRLAEVFILVPQLPHAVASLCSLIALHLPRTPENSPIQLSQLDMFLSEPIAAEMRGGL